MADLFSGMRAIPDNRTWYLVGKDTKDKIRVCHISYEFIENERIFIIHRQTGLLHGKLTNQPDKTIERGKATRNLWEQVELESLHLVKEKLDKGYKEIDKDPEECTNEELEELLGSIVTGQNGIPKPMLAKQADKVTNPKVFDKQYYASRKIDGLRVLIYLGDDNKVHTQSRGAMNYDAAMTEIINHPKLVELMRANPELILDGEAYHHGYSLQKLNSIARTQVTAIDYEVLQFYWYDIVDLSLPFNERLKKMIDIKEQLGITFDPEREFKDEELRIQFVPQEKVSGWDNIKKLHDLYVSEGWEGVVIRLVDCPYKPNSRTNNMLKVKEYLDSEFEIVGYELGLRGSEDMTFKCITEDGQEFLAKPWGDRQQKEEYVNNIDSYIGKMATVKYFYLSDTGVPLQPSVKSIRIEEDL